MLNPALLLVLAALGEGTPSWTVLDRKDYFAVHGTREYLCLSRSRGVDLISRSGRLVKKVPKQPWERVVGTAGEEILITGTRSRNLASGREKPGPSPAEPHSVTGALALFFQNGTLVARSGLALSGTYQATAFCSTMHGGFWLADTRQVGRVVLREYGSDLRPKSTVEILLATQRPVHHYTADPCPNPEQCDISWSRVEQYFS